MKYKECYQEGKSALAQVQIAEADLDARLLLEAVCGTNRNDLLVHGDREVSEQELQKYKKWISQRAQRIPLQHLTGVQDFMGLTFRVNEKVLIPRQDTEILVEEVLRELQDGSRLLDMCTGSGCILISLLHYSNNCEGVGVDISAEALEVAKENARQILTAETYSRSMFLESNLFEKVTGKYDVLVSNPPYIASKVIDTLMPEVKEHEPLLALDGTADGLFFYRKIVSEGREYLNHGGQIYFEIGYDQAEAVSEMLRENGFTQIQVAKDYAGLDRVVYGTFLG